MKTLPARFLIFLKALPFSSIFALSVGAGKVTRAMQPSLPSAVQRPPPPSVDESSLSRLCASATSSALSSFSRSDFSLISRFERDSFGHEALEHVVGHGRAFFGSCFPRLPRRICSGGYAMRWLYTRFFQRPFAHPPFFLQRPWTFSGILPRPTKFFDGFWVSRDK